MTPDRMSEFSVTIVGDARPEAIVDVLREFGCKIGAHEPDVVVVATDDYSNPELAAFGRKARVAKQVWLPVKLTGTVPWMGPFFELEGPCWACLEQRLAGKEQVRSFLAAHRQRKFASVSHEVKTIAHAAAHLVAAELVKWGRTIEPSKLRRNLLTFDATTLETRLHPVLQRPQCPLCGDQNLFSPNRAPTPLFLGKSRKKLGPAASHRGAFADEIVERYGHLISPVTGVVSDLTRRHDRDGITFHHSARHDFPLPFGDVSALRTNLRGRSGGKGTTEAASVASAIGEALERYSGVFQGEEEISIRASYEELGELAIHPNDCLLFSSTQYDNRQSWNAAQGPSRFHIVPERFGQDVPIAWTPVWSITRQTFRYFPTSYCFYGHPDLLRWGFCGADSNGCAAGSSIVEALVHGFLELIERDSVALWWYNEIPRPLVDVDSFETGAYYRLLRRSYDKVERSIWVIDITSDTQIPSFAAISARRDGPPDDIILGFGTHLDANLAVTRALTELHQLLPMVQVSKGEGRGYGTDDPDAVRWFVESTLSKQTYLSPLQNSPAHTSRDYRNLVGDDLFDDASYCLDSARRLGLEVYCLDQTRPDVKMPTCRVIVPGLRHFWRRLAPGRLYDVPVRLGWIAKPKVEVELNPFSLFF